MQWTQWVEADREKIGDATAILLESIDPGWREAVLRDLLLFTLAMAERRL
jgi:hypothetical protein